MSNTLTGKDFHFGDPDTEHPILKDLFGLQEITKLKNKYDTHSKIRNINT